MTVGVAAFAARIRKGNAMATIDVIVPVRNGMPFLTDAIDSIRSQSFSDWRMIVLDHGSSDSSLETARRYAETDRRISVHAHPEADGVGSLRNIGLGLCDCRYVLLQDADDISLPDRMDKILKAFAEAPDLLAVGGEAIVIDTVGRKRGYLPVLAGPGAVAAASIFNFPMIHPASALNFSRIGRLGALYGKDFLRQVPDADSITVNRLAEDYIMFGQLALAGPCANLNTPLIQYRRHPASVGIQDQASQIEAALSISRFLATSFCRMHGLAPFDPAPFCNHADYVFDYFRTDYSEQYRTMAEALRAGFGPSAALDRELEFRKVLAARKLPAMTARFMKFWSRYPVLPGEKRSVRNWLLRNVRRGKYIYRPHKPATAAMSAA